MPRHRRRPHQSSFGLPIINHFNIVLVLSSKFFIGFVVREIVEFTMMASVHNEVSAAIASKIAQFDQNNAAPKMKANALRRAAEFRTTKGFVSADGYLLKTLLFSAREMNSDFIDQLVY